MTIKGIQPYSKNIYQNIEFEYNVLDYYTV